MPAEAFMYALFPWLAKVKRPARVGQSLLQLAGVWAVGMAPGLLYLLLQPDGIAHPDRWSWGPWLQALKYTPLPHLASFLFGILLAGLDELVPRAGRLRLLLGVAGLAGVFILLELRAAGSLRPPSRRPADAALRLHRSGAGRGELAGVRLQRAPAGRCGRGQLLPLPAALQPVELDSRHPSCRNRLGLARFDPWLSYAVLLAVALAALNLVEKPAQRRLRRWMGA
jgi:peptidoglycan/LPS O-acetylase OafA/YrhL